MIIDCLKIKEQELKGIKAKIEKLNIKPKLCIISVGDDYASSVYIKNKKKLAQELGIGCEISNFDESVQENELISHILMLNNHKEVDGILLQLPLPKHIDEEKVTNLIIGSKDVDGFTFESMGKLMKGIDSVYACTPTAVMKIIDELKIDLNGKNVLIASRSNIVGKPLAMMCINAGATVTVANSKTKNIQSLISGSDIFVSAIGRPKYFDKSYFKDTDNLVVIDVGINRDAENKLCGDVDTIEVEKKVKAITPVPKGVGVLTVVEVMNNIIKLKDVK